MPVPWKVQKIGEIAGLAWLHQSQPVHAPGKSSAAQGRKVWARDSSHRVFRDNVFSHLSCLFRRENNGERQQIFSTSLIHTGI